jgi:hypothetical protein
VSQFVVDASTLQSLRTELGLLHTRLEAMPRLVDGFEGLLGGGNMDQAVEDFCTRWHHGVSQVAGEITDLMGGLEKAGDAYQRIDDRVRHRATSGWWGGPRPITGARGGRITPAAQAEGPVPGGPASTVTPPPAPAPAPRSHDEHAPAKVA